MKNNEENPVYDASGENQHRRAADNSKLIQILENLRRYAIIWIPLAWFATQVGFSVVTPLLTSNRINAKIDTVKEVLQIEIDTLKYNAKALQTVHYTLDQEINALRKFDCLDPRITARDKLLAGLHCETP